MSRVRHDLGGDSRQTDARASKGGGKTNSDKIKLAVAVGILVVACAVIAYEVFPQSAPRPVANPNAATETPSDAGLAPGQEIPNEAPRPRGSGKAGSAR